jgi:hypothetical protein
MWYYLVDGIYPPWATLISGIPQAQSTKQKYFTIKQSEYRKDVERAFGVLHAKYAIMKGPTMQWSVEDFKYFVDCVIIWYNMGIVYESGMEELRIEDYDDATRPSLDPNWNVPNVQQLIDRHRQIQSRVGNEQLKADLACLEPVWRKLAMCMNLYWEDLCKLCYAVWWRLSNYSGVYV